MRFPATACLFAGLPLALCFDFAPLVDRISSLESWKRTSVRFRDLDERDVQSGGTCGGSNVCASGLCCSPGNICGTGIAYCGAPGCQLSYGPACDGNKTPPGANTSSIPRPLFGNVPYGVGISHCTVNGKVALTFDDGPYIYTAELLDLLKSNNVSATFFVVGANGGKGQIENATTGYPAIIRRMYAEGHQIGSHSWSHQDLTSLTVQQRRDQIIRNEIAFNDILGMIPTYFRPPYTLQNADMLADLKNYGYHVTNYDIDTRDWQGDYTYSQNTYTNILQQHSPSSSSWIAIAHDIQDKTVHGFAQYMINQARAFKYELTTLGDCLGDQKANWYRNGTTGQPYTPAGVILSGATGSQQQGAVATTTSHSPTSTGSGGNFGAGTGNTSTESTASAPGATKAAVSSAASTSTQQAQSTQGSSASGGLLRINSAVSLLAIFPCIIAVILLF